MDYKIIYDNKEFESILDFVSHLKECAVQDFIKDKLIPSINSYEGTPTSYGKDLRFKLHLSRKLGIDMKHFK